MGPVNRKLPETKIKLFTAMALAKLCVVDLKTIHNWAANGEIPHFRTPGRHLRFRQPDVVEFLQKFGYAVPTALLNSAARIYVIDDDRGAQNQAKRGLADRYEVTTFSDPFDALIAIGAQPPRVLVVETKTSGFDAMRCVARFKDLSATRTMPVIVFSTSAEAKRQALAAGAASFVLKPDVASLRHAVDTLLG